MYIVYKGNVVIYVNEVMVDEVGSQAIIGDKALIFDKPR